MTPWLCIDGSGSLSQFGSITCKKLSRSMHETVCNPFISHQALSDKLISLIAISFE